MTESLYFQYNTKLRIENGNKPDSDKLTEFNKTLYWHKDRSESVEEYQQSIIEKVESGESIRFGVKESGNRIEAFRFAWGTAIDLDCYSLKDLEKFRSSPILESAFYGYPSTSFGKPETNRAGQLTGKTKYGYRYLFTFNRAIEDPDDVKRINYGLMAEFQPEILEWLETRSKVDLAGLDNSCNDPARLWYGCDPDRVESLKDEGYFYLNLEAVLDTSSLLDVFTEPVINAYIQRQQINKLEQTSDDKKSNTNRAICKHLENVLGANTDNPFALVEKLISIGLENGYDHISNWKNHGSPGDAVFSYRGADPLHKYYSNGYEPTLASDSFVISRQQDGTYVWSSNKAHLSGEITELIYVLSTPGIDKYPKHFEDSDHDALSRELKTFNGKLKVINKFLTDWDLPVMDDWKPDSKSESKSSQNEVKEEAESFESEVPGLYLTDKGQLRLDPIQVWKWFLNEYQGKFEYCALTDCYHIYHDNFWKVFKNAGRVRAFIKDQFSKRFGSVEYKGVTIELWEFFKTAFMGELSNQISSIHSPVPVLKHCRSHVPFTNGLFNILTKELEPFNPHVKNVFIQPFDYVESTGEGLKLLRDVLESILDVPLDQRDQAIRHLIGWIASVIQYRGFDTKLACVLVGDSNAGKTWLTEMIIRMIDFNVADEKETEVRKELVIKTNAERFFNGKERFESVALEDKILVVLEEWKGIPKGMDGSKLKDCIANEDSRGSLQQGERKHGDHFSMRYRGAFLTNSQEYPNLKNSQDMGFLRRLMAVKIKGVSRDEKDLTHQFTMLNPHNADHKTDEQKCESLRLFIDLYCDLLRLDIEPILEEFRQKGFNPDWLKLNRQEMDEVNCVETQFIKQMIIYDTESKGLFANQLYTDFIDWTEQQKIRYAPSSTTFGKKITQKLSEIFSIPLKEVKVLKKQGTLYQHIRLRTEADDHREFEESLQRVKDSLESKIQSI